jgi:hypothetical protein
MGDLPLAFPPAEEEPKGQMVPPVPETIEETGLSSGLLEQLVSKILFLRGDTMGRDLARAIGLKFSLIQAIMDFFKRHHLVEVKRSLGMGDISAVFALTENGRKHAASCMEKNQYAGVAPVPLWQYATAVRMQRLENGWLKPEMLSKAFEHMVMNPRTLSQIGPAVNAGCSFLIYGQPGNGKTYLAEALMKLDQPDIFVPHAIEFQGSIIQVFDPIFHERTEREEQETVLALDSEARHDGRWVRCKRPFIVTGGELMLDMLDLKYHHATKIYDAPLQLKANNGIYLVDDFGRQKVTPAEVLNRWIVPMEKRADFLNVGTGGKMEVPFECFLVFSTNLKPEQLGDEAFLRRIQYKMLVGNPREEEFRAIFDSVCVTRGLRCEPEVRDRFIHRRYATTTRPMRRCQPRDVVSHAINFIRYQDLPMVLTDEVLDEAFDSCFVDTSAMDS